MSYNKIYSGMENAPDAIDKNFNNTFPKDQALTDETAALLGVVSDDPTPEEVFALLGSKLDGAGDKIWGSGNLQVETGAWTPDFIGGLSDGSFEYISQAGSYYRIDSLVVVQFDIRLSRIVTPPTGSIRVRGLPFASATHNGVLYYPGVSHIYSGINAGAGRTLSVTVYENEIALYSSATDGSDFKAIDVSSLSDNLVLYAGSIYLI